MLTNLCDHLQEVVPDSKMIEKMNDTFKQLITKSVECVSKTVSNLSHPLVIEKFFWSFIASCCNQIRVGVKDLNKLGNFYFAIEKFSKIFKAYCEVNQNTSQPMHELPEQIKCIPHESIKDYFRWIIKLQKIYTYWQDLFEEKQCNYDDIFAYASSLATVTDLAALLGTSHLIYGADKIEQFKFRYSKLYEKVCLLLVKSSKEVEGYVSVFMKYHWCVCVCVCVCVCMCMMHLQTV